MEVRSNGKESSTSTHSTSSDPRAKKRKLVGDSSSPSSPRLPPPQSASNTPNQTRLITPSELKSSKEKTPKKKNKTTTSNDPSPTSMDVDDEPSLPRFNTISLEATSTSSSILTKPRKHLGRLAARLGLEAPSYETRPTRLDKASGQTVFKERVVVGVHSEKGSGWTKEDAQKKAALKLMRSGKLGVSSRFRVCDMSEVEVGMDDTREDHYHSANDEEPS
ncbi:hypothetical protein BDY24DRAFT_419194 [Mrakia frigida]|uniref:double-stranded RNA binding motif domain-containing protein n=1 Tax=Mrakia frigida TaxID=29902 RepID=UPI003FCC0925